MPSPAPEHRPTTPSWPSHDRPEAWGASGRASTPGCPEWGFASHDVALPIYCAADPGARRLYPSTAGDCKLPSYTDPRGERDAEDMAIIRLDDVDRQRAGDARRR